MSNNQDTVLKVLIKQTMLPIEQFWRKKLKKKDWIKIEQSRGVEQTKNKQQLNFAASAKASSSEKRPEKEIFARFLIIMLGKLAILCRWHQRTENCQPKKLARTVKICL